MRFIRYIISLFLLILSVCSCHERKYNAGLSLGYFSEISSERYSVDNSLLREEMRRLVVTDKDRTELDVFVRKYYQNSGSFLWITRNGVSANADTLLRYISDIGHIGFDPEKFYCSQIRNDVEILRNLEFDDSDNINSIIARLEYYLTKAYIRYCAGQRFGFVNPTTVLNTLDVDDSDTVNVRYKCLYDIPMRHPNRAFYNEAFRKIVNDSVGIFLSDSRPQNYIYNSLLLRLGKCNKQLKIKYLCNMERARWRLDDYPENYEKYVFINLPSQTLEAVNEKDRMSMKIIYGKASTKTPLLSSKINRLDFNPKWVIPKSIIRKDIVRHIHDDDYFIRNNYYVMERKSGERVELSEVTKDMLLSNEYRVIQEGGAGNSLGRVIFRFNNNFSVFLHDTSSPGVFARIDRRASHGCIRVEKPFDLAVFMLSERDEDVIKKINYSMTAPVHLDGYHEGDSEDKKKESVTSINKKLYINSLKVEPTVPLFITYYTIYPAENNEVREYSDIYGYDQVIYEQLKRFM